MNPQREYPPQPYYHQPNRESMRPGSPYPQGDPNYSGVYGLFKTEREKALELQLAQAQGKMRLLEQQINNLQRDLRESQRKLTQWRLNIRTVTIAFLSIFIVVWATVSILVQYPVLPWNMPSAIGHLMGQ